MIHPTATKSDVLALTGTNRWTMVRSLARPARDFLMGIVIFTVIALALTYAPDFGSPSRSTSPFAGSAHAATMTTSAPHATLVRGWRETGSEATVLNHRSIGQRQGLIILGTTFATILALNMAFLRHLRRAYMPR